MIDAEVVGRLLLIFLLIGGLAGYLICVSLNERRKK